MDEFIVEELKLGDVIKITGSQNGIFLITYIDDDKMQIENETDKFVLQIDDQKVDGIIELQQRNPEEGYARQNGLLEGVWITITFNVDGQLEDINGEIIGLEEDCIEVKIYPNNDIVYIDFGYNGLPENLNISEIKIQNVQNEVQTEINVDQEIIGLIEEGDRIGESIGRRKMKEITEYVNVSESRKRFSLEDQTNDLLEDLLSSIPEYERTRNVVNGIYRMIERYVQLRKEFSVVDEDKITYIKHGANYRPLVQSLMEFNKSLFWLMPVTEIIKKNVIELDEDNNVIDEDFIDIQRLNEIIINYRTIHVENRYSVFVKELQKWFAPFSQITEHKNIIKIGPVKDNFKVIVNNGRFETAVVKCGETCNIDTKKMFSIRYNNHTEYKNPQDDSLTNLFEADVLYLKSLITLPEPFAKFSCVTLPGTSILEKSNIGRFFIDYNKLFKLRMKNVNVTPYLKNSLINERNAIKGSIQGDKFLEDTKNYFINANEVKRDVLFEDYLSEIIPPTKQLFQLMKKYIHGKLSIVQIIKTLEPFLIYSSDITFQQYKEMSEFLNDEIGKYVKTYHERIEIFRKLKNHDEQYCPNRLVEIFEDTNLINDVYNYESYPNMSSSELLNNILFFDYGDVYNNKLRLDSLSLSESNLNEKLKQTQEFSENTCKAIHLAKRYKSLDDLENDNLKTIFYDEEFDKTPYYLLSNYEKERSIMSQKDFYLFLETVLKNEYSMSEKEIKSIISAFQYRKREIDEDKNVYAMIFNKIDGKIDYYVRREKKWERDDSIKDQPITDDLACILQENCMVSKSDCLSDNVAKEEYVKTAISKIVSEFDKNVALTRGETRNLVNDLFDDSIIRAEFLVNITINNKRKYNYEQYDLGRDVNDENSILSPYIKLRDHILSEMDIIKKYDYILEFVKKYTFVMSERTSLSPKYRYSDIDSEDSREMSEIDPEASSQPEMRSESQPDMVSDSQNPKPESHPENSIPEKQYNFNKVSSLDVSEEEFAKYIREKDENMHWLFCKKTRTKLLPKFFYILAKTFVDMP